MINQLASPTVCVVDDEAPDFEPILKALNTLFVSAVHIAGTIESLPAAPFRNLRLVFFDLHLSTAVGKDAASYAANVFTKIVASDTAPIIVVIWSKYAHDKLGQDAVPPDDQKTEADLFRDTLLGADPGYAGRLIFVEMAKPKPEDRPAADAWVENLKAEIDNALKQQPAIEALWAWDSLVKESSSEVSGGLTTVAQALVAGTAGTLGDGLKATMQKLAEAHAEDDLSAATAPLHLTMALSQLLADQLEHPGQIDEMVPHGDWLSEAPNPATTPEFAAHMNGLLLTADLADGATPYAPGTVYKLRNDADFLTKVGVPVTSLLDDLCSLKDKTKDGYKNFVRDTRVIFVELSPVCDVAQKKRVSSMLVAGLLVPALNAKQLNNAASHMKVPATFKLRWERPGFPKQATVMILSHNFKVTVPREPLADWLEPWFRLRELPTTAIRNANAAHAARVGFVSV